MQRIFNLLRTNLIETRQAVCLAHNIKVESDNEKKCLKFKTNAPILQDSEKTREYCDRKLAKLNPLAGKIFAIDGVNRVILNKDFVQVDLSADLKHDSSSIGPEIASIIQDYAVEHVQAKSKNIEHYENEHHKIDRSSMSNEDADICERIVQVLDDRIRPAVHMDGGDVFFISYEKGILTIKIQGMFDSRGSSMEILKDGILKIVEIEVPQVKEIRDLKPVEDETAERECQELDRKYPSKTTDLYERT